MPVARGWILKVLGKQRGIEPAFGDAAESVSQRNFQRLEDGSEPFRRSDTCRVPRSRHCAPASRIQSSLLGLAGHLFKKSVIVVAPRAQPDSKPPASRSRKA